MGQGSGTSSHAYLWLEPIKGLLAAKTICLPAAGLQFVAVARCCRSLLSLVAVARCMLSLVAVARCCQSLVLLLSAFFPLTGKCTGKVCSLGELCINYLLIPCISLSNFSQLELFAGLLLVRNTFAAN